MLRDISNLVFEIFEVTLLYDDNSIIKKQSRSRSKVNAGHININLYMCAKSKPLESSESCAYIIYNTLICSYHMCIS